jgi:ABC-type transport system substrate-binding protein
MRKEISYTAIALLLILVASMFAVLPATAFVHPDGTYDTDFELYGPHADQLQFLMYASAEAEWTALQSGALDLTDWPLTTTWRTTFSGSSSVNVVSAGGANSMYLLDFNDDNNSKIPNPDSTIPSYPVGRANPVFTSADAKYPQGIPPVSSNAHFRLACGHLYDRTAFATFLGGAGTVILTPMPNYMTGYVWSGATGYTYSESDAIAELNAGGIYNNTGTWYWNYKDGTQEVTPDAAEIAACNNLIFTYRQDAYRTKAGQLLSDELIKMGFGFKAGYPKSVSGGTNYQEVMIEKNYHITTLGWVNIGPDPDYLYDLYNPDAAFWDSMESSCPNTADLNDTFLNTYEQNIKFASSYADATGNCTLFQIRFEQICAQIPIYSSQQYMASSKRYTGGNGGVQKSPDDGENAYRNQSWFGIGNQMAYGTNTWFSTLNMYPNGSMYGSGAMTIRYGWEVNTYPEHINPFYSEWYWDSLVLGAMYDTLGYRNIYNLAEWDSDLITGYSTGSWFDPVARIDKAKVTVTLRPDIYWSDGVPMTIADVIFSLVSSGKMLIDAHASPPWWWPTGELVKSLSVVDPYTVEILIDYPSVWAVGWILGGFYIVPEHIWRPLILSGADMSAVAPDPNFIASGPYRYLSWSPTHSLVMVANKPGSTVTTDMTSHGSSAGPGPGQVHAVTSPVGYHNYYPYQLAFDGIGPPYEIYVDPTTKKATVAEKSFEIINKMSFDSISGNKTIKVDGVVEVQASVSIPAGSTYTEYLYNETFSAGNHDISFSFTMTDINGTLIPPGLWPWLTQTINVHFCAYFTIPEDIAGSTLYDDMGWGNYTLKSESATPDFKVDIQDVARASGAFGSFPGHPRWNSICDINGDYKVDIQDLARVSAKFGWHK